MTSWCCLSGRAGFAGRVAEDDELVMAEVAHLDHAIDDRDFRFELGAHGAVSSLSGGLLPLKAPLARINCNPCRKPRGQRSTLGR